MSKIQQKQKLLIVFLLLMVIITILLTRHSNEFAPHRAYKPSIDYEDDESWLNLTYGQFVDVKYRLEFDEVLKKSCNPANLSANYECLDELNKLDKRFSSSTSYSVSIPASWRLDCTNDKRRHVFFHTYWHLSNSIDLDSVDFRMLRLSVMSYLASQNSACSTLILWLSREFSDLLRSKILETFAYYIRNGQLQLRRFDFNELCDEANIRGCHFAKSYICTSKLFIHRIHLSMNVIGFSDLVRFFVLDIYGGILRRDCLINIIFKL